MTSDWELYAATIDAMHGSTLLICLECACSYRPLFFHLAQYTDM